MEKYNFMEVLINKNRIRRGINKKLYDMNYELIEPSFFESYDSFMHIHGRIAKQKTVKVINKKGEIEILRPDVTLNILKNISKNWNGDVIKLCYDSTVFRDDNNSGIAETRQIGAETYGDISIDCDVEMIKTVISLLEDIDDVVLSIGSSKYLNGLMGELNFSEEELNEINNFIDKKNIDELENILNIQNVSTELKEKIIELVEVDNRDYKNYKEGYTNSQMIEAIKDLIYTESKLKNISDKNIKVVYDLSLTSEFDYYDGLVFKVYHKELNKPFIKGGRYDKLSNLYDANIPAVGFSMNFDDYYKITKEK